ncbi:MAG: translation initiation factor IF-2 [Flavobacteriaceae bacterium]|nr:translation initiation factor IF-2 [Flavobacteriaceae bacterium]|tara:strand:+ start:469 stop:3075 length:2607 start_codon:yes stop_codon:yes gene_type:complete
MADNGLTLRLNKVLRELNISLDRAVEYLSNVGCEIEARPTTKISQKTYDLLLEGFRTDKTKKDESTEISEEKRKEKENLRLEQEKIDQEKVDILEKKNEIITASSSVRKFKPVGKIDLESKNTSLSGKSKIEAINKKNLDENQKNISSDEKASTENDKLLSNYKKIIAPVKTGERVDLDKIKQQEKSVQASRKKKRKRIITKEAPQKKTQTTNFLNKNSGKRGLTKNQPLKIEPSEEEVQKQVRETLEKLQSKSSKSKGAKYRKDKRVQHKQKSEEEQALQEAQRKILRVTEFITVGEVATMMEVAGNEIISACMSLGIMVTMNQRLDAETLTIVAEEFGFKVEFAKAEVEDNFESEVDDKESELTPRAPIVTVMGHVDHGKTSLLDFIRNENVIAGESGGITQHIGAYSVTLENQEKITFLDTPGHEAFTSMRARGAQLTDIAVIVIAADDDIMPQTKEAISHAQAATVPIVFAINKVDKETANPDKIKEGLANMNLMVEDWGGKIQSQDISALDGKGVKELLEKVLLEAELLELTANFERPAKGTVVEAYLDKGRGFISTLLVQSGTLKIGDFILAGKNSGKVKALFDERGKNLSIAPPSTPVSILGLDGAPQAGDNFLVLKDEKEAKQIAAKRTQLQREQNVRTQRHVTLDEIGRRIALGEFKELNIVLKGDVDGSVEALSNSLENLSTQEIEIKILHKGVGAITESDIILATASDAIVIGFNVRPVGNAKSLSDKEKIDVRTYSIIYDAINDVKDAMEGMLSPEYKEEITGNAEIRETYKISKLGTVAGCMVTSGKIFKNSGVRLIRDGVVVFTGALLSLKRFKDDVKEVAKGYDCGIQIKGFNDLKTNDLIEAFQEIEVKKKL